MAWINPHKDDVYLGDSVYLRNEQQVGAWLYTWNGVEVSNEIFLEPEIIIKFVKELEKMVK
jgi:hypothetical protein